jgi:hypothetical protein
MLFYAPFQFSLLPASRAQTEQPCVLQARVTLAVATGYLALKTKPPPWPAPIQAKSHQQWQQQGQQGVEFVMAEAASPHEAEAAPTMGRAGGGRQLGRGGDLSILANLICLAFSNKRQGHELVINPVPPE